MIISVQCYISDSVEVGVCDVRGSKPLMWTKASSGQPFSGVCSNPVLRRIKGVREC